MFYVARFYDVHYMLAYEIPGSPDYTRGVHGCANLNLTSSPANRTDIEDEAKAKLREKFIAENKNPISIILVKKTAHGCLERAISDHESIYKTIGKKSITVLNL